MTAYLVPARWAGALSVALWAAATMANEPPLELTPMVVSGERVQPLAARSTVSAETLDTQQGLSLDDALQGLPGVFAQNQYNAAQGLRPSIRGFGARAAFGVRGIRVLLDGVPLTLPTGQTELDAIDLQSVTQVDVLRGPAATALGNAAGGVIAIQTRDAGEARRGEITAGIGELGAQQWRAEAQSALAGNWRGIASARHSELDTQRDNADTRTTQATAKLQNDALSIRASAVDTTSQDPGALNASQRRADRDQAAPRNLQFNGGERIRQQRLAARWSSADDTWTLSSHAGQRAFDSRLPFENGGQIAFERRFGGLGAQWQAAFGAVSLAAGLDAQLQRDDRSRYDNLNGQRGDLTLLQDEAADAAGLHANAKIALGGGWTLPVGLRFDRLRLDVRDRFLADGDDSGRRNFDDWSGAIGLAKQWHAPWSAWLRVASSFESPTTTELANPNGGGFNPALESAEAINTELGLLRETDRLRLEAVVFSIAVDDELVPFELAGQPGRSFFRNAGSSSRDGLELAARWAMTPHWTLHASATRARYRFDDAVIDGDDVSGNRTPGLPEQTGSLSVDWASGLWRAGGSLYAVGDLQADDANTTRVPGYATLRLHGGWSAGRYAVTAGINNVLDADYNDNVRINAFGGRYFEPAPGRNAWLRLTAKFGASET